MAIIEKTRNISGITTNTASEDPEDDICVNICVVFGTVNCIAI
jgi:hypothetical protein